MQQKNKELLLKDLCARLPYGVKVRDELGRINKLVIGNADLVRLYYKDFSIYSEEKMSLPYLFPLSSMTDEQKKEYYNLCIEEEREKMEFGEWVTRVYYHNTIESIDWLNKNHFDYRGLIEKGLAIDTTGLNIY